MSASVSLSVRLVGPVARKRYGVFTAVVAASSTATGADAVAHRPTAIPDRIVLTLSGDPSRQMGVTWRTDTSVAPGQAGLCFNPAFLGTDLMGSRTC